MLKERECGGALELRQALKQRRDQLYVFELAEPVTTRRARFEAVTSTGGNTGARELQLY